jgi:hypothetical protein
MALHKADREPAPRCVSRRNDAAPLLKRVRHWFFGQYWAPGGDCALEHWPHGPSWQNNDVCIDARRDEQCLWLIELLRDPISLSDLGPELWPIVGNGRNSTAAQRRQRVEVSNLSNKSSTYYAYIYWRVWA